MGQQCPLTHCVVLSDCTLLPVGVVHAHLVVEDEVRPAHRRRVVRDQGPPARGDVVHVEITLECKMQKSSRGASINEISYFLGFLTLPLVST